MTSNLHPNECWMAFLDHGQQVNMAVYDYCGFSPTMWMQGRIVNAPRSENLASSYPNWPRGHRDFEPNEGAD